MNWFNEWAETIAIIVVVTAILAIITLAYRFL